MSRLTDLATDLDVEFDRLLQAQDADEQRRALRNVLEILYSLRCHREEHTHPSPSAYRSRASVCHGGRVTEGIILLRGQMMHKVTKRFDPEKRGLYPGPKTYPGKCTFPGSNLTWLHPQEMPDRMPPEVVNDVRYGAYVADVSGRPVLETLQIAKDFLVNDPVLGPLP